jgi:hypothetical protein
MQGELTKKFRSAVLRIRDLVRFDPLDLGSGMEKNPNTGTKMNIPDIFPRAYKNFLGLKILKLFYANQDPGSVGNLFNPGSGSRETYIETGGVGGGAPSSGSDFMLSRSHPGFFRTPPSCVRFRCACLPRARSSSPAMRTVHRPLAGSRGLRCVVQRVGTRRISEEPLKVSLVLALHNFYGIFLLVLIPLADR